MSKILTFETAIILYLWSLNVLLCQKYRPLHVSMYDVMSVLPLYVSIAYAKAGTKDVKCCFKCILAWINNKTGAGKQRLFTKCLFRVEFDWHVSGTTIMTAINNHHAKTISEAHYYLALKTLSKKTIIYYWPMGEKAEEWAVTHSSTKTGHKPQHL